MGRGLRAGHPYDKLTGQSDGPPAIRLPMGPGCAPALEPVSNQDMRDTRLAPDMITYSAAISACDGGSA